MKQGRKVFATFLAVVMSITMMGSFDVANETEVRADENTYYAGNPIITNIFTADPSAHAWEANGKLYIYASHDIFPSKGCDLMDKYHVFSTDNMVTWKDEGEILSSDDVSWGRPEGGFMWAPDAAYKDGTYYFYFPHPTGSGDAWNSTWRIGIAKSSSPASGFT
jgi:beta-xylosidase